MKIGQALVKTHEYDTVSVFYKDMLQELFVSHLMARVSGCELL